VPYEQIYHGAVDDPIYKKNRFFRDKIILIGDVTHLGNDYHPTPVGTMSGVEIHAHAIATLLQGAFVREVPLWIDALALLVLATLAYALAAYCTLRAVVPLAALTALAYFVLNVWLFVDRGTNMVLVAPLVAAALVTLCAVTERGWREERERKRARSTLEQFVSPQVASAGAPIGTVTLVFADLEDSSMLSAIHGAAFEAVRAMYFGLLRDAVKQWNGFEVETAGDSLFLVFSKADDAVRFAVDAQLALTRHAWPAPVGAIRVRIGLHTGEPFVSKDRTKLTYRGAATNHAARVATVAQGRQVLISEATYGAVRDVMPPHITFRFRGHHVLRGVGEDNLYQVCHPDLSCDFAPTPDEGKPAAWRATTADTSAADKTRH
jgi:class 3 adenylate cyclase